MLKNSYSLILVAGLCVLGLCFGINAYAQKPPPNAEADLSRIGGAALLRADAMQLQAVDTAKLKGKVVLVYNWSTRCAVCLEKMQEIRNNIGGWKGKPFVVIAISRDVKRQDFEDYHAIAKQLNTPSAQLILIHAKDLAVDNLFRHGQLPLSFIIDTAGTVQHMHVGRIPPEAWDQIAELLP